MAGKHREPRRNRQKRLINEVRRRARQALPLIQAVAAVTSTAAALSRILQGLADS